MTESDIKEILLKNIVFAPTQSQEEAVDVLLKFLYTRGKVLFLLKGYAGTGKTTIIAALVNTLQQLSKNFALLAPTGRAAKVMSLYANKPAFTIHKQIYKVVQTESGNRKMILQQNKLRNAIFIIDEASMISAQNNAEASQWKSSGTLLDDLMDYIYSGVNCKAILVGDTAQLPPVGMTLSYALDQSYLQDRFDLDILNIELTEVVRQLSASGILANATQLRYAINNNNIKDIQFSLGAYDDIKAITGEFLEDELNDAYSQYREENVMIITRSNKRANLFNQQIRARIRWLEDEIAAGDLIMVVKNNYFWLDESAANGFIANGDIGEITQIMGYEELYGFHFADVNIKMIDYLNQPEIEVKIMLDSLTADGPSISSEEQRKFYFKVADDYKDIPNKRKRKEKIKKNPYFNALQVKFAYAVTCHKSQGGQWDAVFVDQGYLNEEMLNIDFLRWLYTAITRAKKMLYLVNFHSVFIDES